MDQTRKRNTPGNVGETNTSIADAGTLMTRGQERGVRRPKCVWPLVGALVGLAFLLGGAGDGARVPVASAKPVVYVAPIRGMIDLGLVPYVDRVLTEAAAAGAAAVILQIDTFGGRVDAAVQLSDSAQVLSGEDRNRTLVKNAGKTQPSRESGADSGALAESPEKSRPSDTASVDPDLAAIIAAWPTLPPAIRAGVTALVRAAGGHHE